MTPVPTPATSASLQDGPTPPEETIIFLPVTSAQISIQSPEFDYAGETAMVTGSTAGIGVGVARALAWADSNVVINSRTEAAVAETAAQLADVRAGETLGVPANIGRPADVEHVSERFGQVDLLVNNAVAWPEDPSLLEADLDAFDLAMNVNVRRPFYGA